MYYSNQRWLGGTLTNFQTIKQQIRRLKELEQGQDEFYFSLPYDKMDLCLWAKNHDVPAEQVGELVPGDVVAGGGGGSGHQWSDRAAAMRS